MDRTSVAARAALQHSPPRIALLEALGLTALVVPVRKSVSFGARDHLDFIALGADRRLRWGTMWTFAEERLPRPVPGIPSVHCCRRPEDADALAMEIALAVEAMEAGTAIPAPTGTPPFSLSGWSPSTRQGFHDLGTGFTAPREPEGFAWLGGEALGNDAANRLWDQAFASSVPAEDLEAAGLFEVCGSVDYAAFDACRQVGEAGRMRRSFARANPLLASAALRAPTIRAMVDAGARLKDILDAMAVDGRVDLAPPGSGERRSASKRALTALSGRTLAPDAPYRNQDDVISAAEGLPRDWLPTNRNEAAAFANLCDLARRVYKEPVQDGDEAMWRQAMAGSSGRWVEFARRVADARGTPDGGDARSSLVPLETLGLVGIMTRMVHHFVRDILAPVAITYGDGTTIRLAGHVIRGRRRYQNADAFLRFGRESLLAGMALPAYADSLRRHADARAAIRSVVTAHPPKDPAPGSRRHSGIVVLSNGVCLRPKAGWTDEPGPDGFEPDPSTVHSAPPSWSEVTVASMANGGIMGLPDTMPDTDGSPTPQVAMIVKRVYADYTFETPGAVEAMLDAWRRALPRRWRNLDARSLAAAFDAEAAAFAVRHGIEPGSPAETPTL